MAKNGELSPTIGAHSGGTDCSVTIHAVLPPPVTGMTACTASMADALSQQVAVRRYSWSNGAATIGPWFRLVKAGRALRSPWKLLFSRRPANGVFYMPVNGRHAIFYNLMTIAAARLRGYRCAVHHHFYAYLDHFDWRHQLLDRLLGPNGLHVVLCPDMEQRLRERYACRAPIAIVPSTIQLLQSGIANSSAQEQVATPAEPFRLGHISNLQVAKGLDLVIEVLRVLRARGRNVQLVLAGPIHSKLERSMIDNAQTEFGDVLDYRGPVYQEEKQRFFRDIHVKLYPTRYPDAQPLVITEAFANGRPVISYGRGCIPGMIGPGLDWSIPTRNDFVPRAVDLIEQWMDDPGSYGDACQAARQRFDALLDEARDALAQFIGWVNGEPDRGFVHRSLDNKLIKLYEVS
jgi:glycosyltransferase involved in cell wall biosynthesis